MSSWRNREIEQSCVEECLAAPFGARIPCKPIKTEPHKQKKEHGFMYGLATLPASVLHYSVIVVI